MVRTFLDVWEGRASGFGALTAVLRGAIGNEQASAQLRESSRLDYSTASARKVSARKVSTTTW